ncbi:MAG: septal ring lytic transglycosylase RlpA family protein [Hyphomicrobiaceae bacterium]|nr:septal ring lytic transglycosylase RlpA family protein [Hyphomicrobiaceae bacterium]
MRTLLFAAIAAITFGLVNVPMASAGYWACKGGHVACGSKSSAGYKKKAAVKSSYKASHYKKSASKRSAYKKSAHKKSAYKKSASYQRKSRKSRGNRTASRSYSGSSSGIASYYWQPQRVASGGWFNPNAMTAAHKTLPFGTKVRVTNVRNGRSVVVRINDRGPYIRGRVIDLSKAAAGVIGMIGSGVAPVNIAILGR